MIWVRKKDVPVQAWQLGENTEMEKRMIREGKIVPREDGRYEVFSLEAAGATMADVVETTVLLTDIAEFGAMNEVYAEFFEAPYPARAAFQVVALPKGGKVEIKALARI